MRWPETHLRGLGREIRSMTLGRLRKLRLPRFRGRTLIGFRISIVSRSSFNFPPPGQVAFYVEDLRADLRFPILEFIWNILDYYGLCPAQLVPNLVRLIISFALLCQLLPIFPRISLFRTFFVLRSHPKAQGWWFFNLQKELSFITDLPSSIHG